jgi:hypothetical protein
MEKSNENAATLPEVFFGSGESCVAKACYLAAHGKQVALFLPQRNRPSHWAVQSRGLYAVCDADVETKAGLKRALQFVDHQHFDVLLFSTHADDDDEENAPSFLTYSRNHATVIKEAAYFGMSGRMHLLKSDHNAEEFSEQAA